MKKTVAGRTKLSIAVSVALGAGLFGAGFAPLALAQQAGDVQRVEVTGTRLPSLSLEGPSPVTVLNAQDIKYDGQTKAEELLNQLPSVSASQTAAQSNGATGTAQVSLRGLGATRNLVLVNGRRLPPGSPTQGGYAADLNQVPVGLIQRVEVLTGGASGVYGSDAMSGVVNFIMNDKFEGLQINLNHSFYNHSQHNPVSGVVAARAVTNPTAFVVPGDVTSDGDVHNASVLLGGNFANGRGNATVYFDWKKEDPVLQASRDFSACALNSTGPGGSQFACGGSSTSFPGRFFTASGPTFTIDSVTGQPRPFSSATDQFNFGPYNYYRRPSEKYSFGAFAHYDVFSDLRVYSELGFHTDHTSSQIAPSGLFIFDASGPNTIRFENPFLTPAWRTTIAANNDGNPFAAPGDTADMLIGRRNVEGGGRQDDITHTSYRFVFGIKGEAFKYWNYDVSMQTGHVDLKRTYKNDLSNVRIGRALNAVTGPAGPTCQSVLDGTDPNCVPYNLWVLGGPTAAALNYMSVNLLANGYTKQQIVSTNWNVDLGNYGLRVPMAKNGVSLALGAERRKEEMELVTDQGFSSGDGAGQGGATIGRAGKVQVGEYFGEVRVPIIEKRPFADLLQATASYRYSKYSTEKKTNTYGVGVEWAPVTAYRLRGSYQRAVRAANLEELFLAQGNNLFDIALGDPCGAAAVAAGQAGTPAQCANSGVTAAQYGSALLDSPAGQYNFLQGGNPNLNPERADTYTAGLVFQPLRDLNGSIDYWTIKIADYILAAPPTTILNQCVFSNQFCNLVQRDRLGTLWALPDGRVVALNDNLGGLRTNGWDLALNYTHSLGSYGRLGLNFLGTLLTKWEFEPLKGLGKFDCVGLVGSQCGTPNPKWRHKARASWTTPWNVELALTWRHISKVRNETTSGDPLLSGATDGIDAELAKRDYLDIAGSWRINKTFSLSGGVNNITDKDPPIVSQTLAGPSLLGNGNTFPGVYDTLGRLVFMNLQAKF